MKNRSIGLFVFILGFSFYCSFVISLMSLPSFLGYQKSSLALEGVASLLLIPLTFALYAITGYIRKRTTNYRAFLKIYLGLFVANTCLLTAFNYFSLFVEQFPPVPFPLVVFQYALLVVQLTTIWSYACEELDESQLRFALPLAMLVSILFGIAAHYATIALHLPEGAMAFLFPCISSLFLIPLLRFNQSILFQSNREKRLHFSTIIRNPGFLVIGILFIYILSSGVFYSVYTQGMQNYSLSGFPHRIIIIVFTSLLFIVLRTTKRKDISFVYDIIYFIAICIVALYCIAIFGTSISGICREIVLPTRACAFFLIWIVIAELSCAERYSLPKLAVCICLPALFFSRAIMFDAWAIWSNASTFLPSDTLMLAFILVSAFAIMIGTFQLLFLRGKTLVQSRRDNSQGLQESNRINVDDDNANNINNINLDAAICIMQTRYNLSQRETEVIRYISQGYTKKRIAEILFLSINSVSTYTKSAYSKLGVHNRQNVIDLVKGAVEKS